MRSDRKRAKRKRWRRLRQPCFLSREETESFSVEFRSGTFTGSLTETLSVDSEQRRSQSVDVRARKGAGSSRSRLLLFQSA